MAENTLGPRMLKFTDEAQKHHPGYEISAELGRGSFAQVFRGTDLETGAEVACKMGLGSKNPLTAEAAIYERLGPHPNFVAVHAFGQAAMVGTNADWKGQLLVMEQAGPSLLPAIRNGHGVSIEIGMQIAADISGALTRVHAEGLVHRDITPANVLMGHEAIRLCDFGFAAEMTDGRAAPIDATPFFVAPEQRRNHASVQGDLYGLAATVYAGLVGKPPIRRFLRIRPPFKTAISDRRWDERYEEIEPELRNGFHRKKAKRHATPAEFNAKMQEAYARGAAQKVARERREIIDLGG